MRTLPVQKLRNSDRQNGMSLIELMIAMVLGLLVIAALMNMYVGSSRSSIFSEGLRTMQENGRHGVQVLKRGIRLAGYSPETRIQAFDLAAGDESTLVVRMMAERDCNGRSTAASAGIAVNTYALDTANEQITCMGNSALASRMPVIDGVEDFRVLYGIDADDDGFPESYREYSGAVNPLEIRAIRFALLVTSQRNIRSRAVAETHVLLDKQVNSNDQRARHVFTSTVLLRNLR